MKAATEEGNRRWGAPAPKPEPRAVIPVIKQVVEFLETLDVVSRVASPEETLGSAEEKLPLSLGSCSPGEICYMIRINNIFSFSHIFLLWTIVEQEHGAPHGLLGCHSHAARPNSTQQSPQTPSVLARVPKFQRRTDHAIPRPPAGDLHRYWTMRRRPHLGTPNAWESSRPRSLPCCRSLTWVYPVSKMTMICLGLQIPEPRGVHSSTNNCPSSSSPLRSSVDSPPWVALTGDRTSVTGHRRRRRQPADSQPVAVMRDTLILHVNCTLSLSSRVMAPASNHFPLLHPCEKVSMSPSYRDNGDQTFWGMCLQFRLLCSKPFLGGGNFHICCKEHCQNCSIANPGNKLSRSAKTHFRPTFCASETELQWSPLNFPRLLAQAQDLEIRLFCDSAVPLLLSLDSDGTRPPVTTTAAVSGGVPRCGGRAGERFARTKCHIRGNRRYAILWGKLSEQDEEGNCSARNTQSSSMLPDPGPSTPQHPRNLFTPKRDRTRSVGESLRRRWALCIERSCGRPGHDLEPASGHETATETQLLRFTSGRAREQQKERVSSSMRLGLADVRALCRSSHLYGVHLPPPGSFCPTRQTLPTGSKQAHLQLKSSKPDKPQRGQE
ncbi:uncharacterized protein CLUP02_16115 [Colletotrichum lupini]|uniref:Uncharacterized protein n=1 Tax=Colletotrichum lupini TaxID=145971 RepID=A0A9Q8T7U4_9PEZI|nr:uncharacterized protein CLUP02_16115 [Colletotrichum lupini]UQC90585.1 hypothetical protein CLUP02_16115 [Colletotrichum lupini]